MRTTFLAAASAFLTVCVIPANAQSVICPGQTTAINAPTPSSLTGQSYSMNPGGVTSPNPTFAVSPTVSTTYTLYTTGTNSNSAVVTVAAAWAVSMGDPTFSLTSTPGAFSLGCASKSLITVNITGANTQPVPGGVISYSFIPPGGGPIAPQGGLSAVSTVSVNVPGTWTAVVRDNTSFCTTMTPFLVSQNTVAPVLSSFSVPVQVLDCVTPSVVITAQSPNTNVSYNWTSSGFPGIQTGNNLLIQANFSAFTTTLLGNFLLTITDNDNLCNTQTAVPVYQNVYPPFAQISSPAGNTLTCLTPTLILTNTSTSGIPPGTIFSNTAAVVAELWWGSMTQGSLSLSSTYTVTSQDSYTMQVRDLNNGCTAMTFKWIYDQRNYPGGSPTFTMAPVCFTGSQALLVAPSLNPGPTNYSWSVPAGATAIGLSTATLLTNAGGIYTLAATNSVSACAATGTVSVLAPPAAAFMHTVSNGSATFNNTSTGTGPGTSYFWNFGDGTYSTAENPVHAYQNAGSHLVRFYVVNGSTACLDSVIQSVNVTGVPCTANSNFSMALTNTAQVWNAIPAYPWNISAASWDWGDNSTSNTLYTSHQYSAAGLYNICLSVTVSCVASSSSCASYSVYRSSQPVNIIQVNVIDPELISGIQLPEAEMPPSLVVMPNPNAGNFLLSVKGMGSSAAQLTICDLMGRPVYTAEILTGDPVPVKTENLTEGLYFVTIIAGESAFTTKMVIQR